MPGFDEIKSTYRPGASANTAGVDTVEGQALTVEFLSADPTLEAGVPRIWFNTTTNTIKVTKDGATVLATAALT